MVFSYFHAFISLPKFCLENRASAVRHVYTFWLINRKVSFQSKFISLAVGAILIFLSLIVS
jgi:hypothetical protein